MQLYLSFASVLYVLYCRNVRRLIHTRRQQNYYEILGLQPQCTNQEIREAFAKLSKECHPDTSKTSDTARFQSIMEAYRVLSKEDSRANYDAQFVQRRSRFEDIEQFDRFRRDSKFASNINYEFVQETMKARAREKFYEE